MLANGHKLNKERQVCECASACACVCARSAHRHVARAGRLGAKRDELAGVCAAGSGRRRIATARGAAVAAALLLAAAPLQLVVSGKHAVDGADRRLERRVLGPRGPAGRRNARRCPWPPQTAATIRRQTARRQASWTGQRRPPLRQLLLVVLLPLPPRRSVGARPHRAAADAGFCSPQDAGDNERY